MGNKTLQLLNELLPGLERAFIRYMLKPGVLIIPDQKEREEWSKFVDKTIDEMPDEVVAKCVLAIGPEVEDD